MCACVSLPLSLSPSLPPTLFLPPSCSRSLSFPLSLPLFRSLSLSLSCSRCPPAFALRSHSRRILSAQPANTTISVCRRNRARTRVRRFRRRACSATCARHTRRTQSSLARKKPASALCVLRASSRASRASPRHVASAQNSAARINFMTTLPLCLRNLTISATTCLQHRTTLTSATHPLHVSMRASRTARRCSTPTRATRCQRRRQTRMRLAPRPSRLRTHSAFAARECPATVRHESNACAAAERKTLIYVCI